MEKLMKKFIAITTAAAVMSIAFVAPVDAAATQGDGEVMWIDGGTLADPVDGATASITRNKSGVTYNIHTNSLDGPHAFSTWGFIFNCGNTDDCKPIVVGLGGHVVAAEGMANFSGRIGTSENGLTNAMGAELHIVIVDHGPVDGSTLPGEFNNGLPPRFWTQGAVFAH
jgi:hypothetical protein